MGWSREDGGWQFSTRIGPFQVVEQPETTIAFGCWTLEPNDAKFVRFVPPVLLYHPNNYTDILAIDVLTLPAASPNGQAPQIKCASNSSLIVDIGRQQSAAAGEMKPISPSSSSSLSSLSQASDVPEPVVGDHPPNVGEHSFVMNKRNIAIAPRLQEVSWTSVGVTLLLGLAGAYYLFAAEYRKKLKKKSAISIRTRKAKNREWKRRGKKSSSSNNKRKHSNSRSRHVGNNDDEENKGDEKETRTFSFKEYWITNNDDEDSSDDESYFWGSNKAKSANAREIISTRKTLLVQSSDESDDTASSSREWQPVERRAKSQSGRSGKQKGRQGQSTYTTFRFKRQEKKKLQVSPPEKQPSDSSLNLNCSSSGTVGLANPPSSTKPANRLWSPTGLANRPLDVGLFNLSWGSGLDGPPPEAGLGSPGRDDSPLSQLRDISVSQRGLTVLDDMEETQHVGSCSATAAKSAFARDLAVPSTIAHPLVPTQRYPFMIQVEGMNCGGCATTVVNALEAIDGVLGVSVDLVESTAKIWSESPRLDILTVVDAVTKVGMKAYLLPAHPQSTRSSGLDPAPGSPIGRPCRQPAS